MTTIMPQRTTMDDADDWSMLKKCPMYVSNVNRNPLLPLLLVLALLPACQSSSSSGSDDDTDTGSNNGA